MGIKLLIIDACLVAGEEIARHAEVSEEVDVSKDDAAALTRMGRALYLSRDDDPTKGQFTATADDKSRAKRALAAITAERKAREQAAQAQSPDGLSALIAASVAAAVAQALSAQAKPQGTL